MNQQKKIGIKYSVAEISTLVYEFIMAYGLFYMTTVQKIDAGKASTVMSVSMVILAVVGLFVGYVIDKTNIPGGSNRVTMMRVFFPLIILFMAFFVPINLSGGFQFVYYLVIMSIWSGLYGAYVVPLDAMGGVIVDDYNDRTFVRTLCMVFIYVGVILGNTVSTYIRTGFDNAGMNEKTSWFITAGIMAAIAIATFVYAYKATAGAEKNPEVKAASKNIVKEYMDLFKIKAVRVLAIGSMCYMTLNVALSQILLYYGIYVLGMSQSLSATLYTICVIGCFVTSPLVTFLTKKFDKRNAMYCWLGFEAVYALFIIICSPGGILVGILLAAIAGAVNGAVMASLFSMTYDLNEVIEYRYGEAKPSQTMAVTEFARGIGSAIGTKIAGGILVFANFDVNSLEQADSTLRGITLGMTGSIIVIGIITVVIFLGYKVNAKNHTALVKALETKKAGEKIESTDGFAEIVK